ncbi:MAG: pseudouridine synthase [Metamycoplasmataceae bacterium]
MEEKIRVQKLISQAGIASRREAEKLILDKKVKINNKIALLGDRANWDDKINVNGILIQKKNELKYYLINKPKKTICTLKDTAGRTLITDLIDDKDYLFPVGRLDYNTTGVILITNDGDLSNKLTHPSFQIVRRYRARLDEKLNNKELSFLNSDKVIVNDKKSKQEVLFIESKTYLVTLYEGSYHHVKKIFETVNRKVIDLKRIEFAGLTPERLMIGQYRKLKSSEVRRLKSMVEKKETKF